MLYNLGFSKYAIYLLINSLILSNFNPMNQNDLFVYAQLTQTSISNPTTSLTTSTSTNDDDDDDDSTTSTSTTSSTSSSTTTTSSTPSTTSTSSTPTTSSASPTPTSTTPSSTSTSSTRSSTSSSSRSSTSSSNTSSSSSSPSSSSSSTSSSTSPTSSNTSTARPEETSRSNTGAIVGGVVGGIAGAILLIVLAACLYKRKKDKSVYDPKMSMNDLFNSPNGPMNGDNAAMMASVPSGTSGNGMNSSTSLAPLTAAGLTRENTGGSFADGNEYVQARPMTLLQPVQMSESTPSFVNMGQTNDFIPVGEMDIANNYISTNMPNRSASVNNHHNAPDYNSIMGPTAGLTAAAALGGMAATSSSSNRNPMNESYVTITQFIPTQPDEVALMPGDVVEIQRKFEDGWALGLNVRSMETGIIPMTVLSSQPLSGAALKDI